MFNVEEPNEGIRQVSVRCRRLLILRKTHEHLACPYCFGKAEDVERGQTAAFCDFQPGRDPLCFGFPDGMSRYR